MADFGRPDKRPAPPARAQRELRPDEFRWYKRDPSRALAGFRGLSIEQKAIYAVLIELVYEQRGPLEDIDSTLARACDVDVRVFKRVKTELIALDRIKADPDAGTLYDERAIRELAGAGMLSERQSRRAKARKKAPAPHPELPLETPARGEKLSTGCGHSYPGSYPDSYPGSYALNETRTPNEINGPVQANRKEKNIKQSDTPNARAPRAVSPLNGDGAHARHGMTIEEWKRDQRRRLGLHDEGKDDGSSDAQSDAPDDQTPADRTARRA